VGAADELAQVPLFASLSDAERQELAAGFTVKTAEAGSHLIGEGSRGYSFFVLLDGTADVTSQGASIAQLGAGDFFGEIAILGDGRRTATVTASSPSSLLVMFGSEFRQLEAAHPDIAARIRVAMEDRLAARS